MISEIGGGIPRLVIAGTGSGAGKTTVTIGLMAALKRRGLAVQGFKCGPDYIDPSYHTAVTGRISRNLDTWMTTLDVMREIFLRGSREADISVIEGVMGMFDGKDPLANTGSTAEIAELLAAPVLLVVNASSIGRTAAAMVLGFRELAGPGRIAGVIANQCGSEAHFRLVQAAVEQVCGIPVVGWLGREEGLQVPERHLGLVPAIERGELEPFFERAADAVEQGVDLDALLELARRVPPLPWPEKWVFSTPAGGTDQADVNPQTEDSLTIAVAMDAAFNFYYPENLELLEELGARIQPFSPLAGEPVPPEADGVYIGGGFPEEFAEQLAQAGHVGRDLKARAEVGLPIFAECGGYMYLSRSITDQSGRTFPMAGIIPAEVRMQSKLSSFGYREVTGLRDGVLLAEGDTIRGHEYHYSTLTPDSEIYPHAYDTKGLRGAGQDGYATDTLTAGYTHVHFASNPEAAKRLVARCAAYRRRRGGSGHE
ncbi:cobyrinate a,c-diamide synthase [Gorillibacterium sp. sgz5001074]|uniref:cobyrinate a,c-diamide synthase n=1 Tax=Gorillibacterium sp. sgz5001074 TaxID=3446695 RepID=UPI003F67BCFF